MRLRNATAGFNYYYVIASIVSLTIVDTINECDDEFRIIIITACTF